MTTATATALATPAQVRSLLRWTGAVGLDLETTGLNPRRDRIRLLSVSDGRETLVMDCFEHPIQTVLPALAGKIVVAHNASFDLGFLWHAGLTDLPETVCTYILGQLLHAGEGGGDHGFPPLNLAACCQRYLGKAVSKELQASDWSGPLSADQIEYARQDAALMPRLHVAMTNALETAKLLRVSEYELQALPAFVWMAQRGVPFDRDAWKALADQAAVERAEITQKLNALAPAREKANLFGDTGEWNWDSPKQVGDVLAALGLPVPSTNDYYLSEVESRHPIGGLLRKHRELSKRLSTYGHDWLQHVAADGRVYPGWRQIGAASGRTSCASPNMQQLPRDKVKLPDGRKIAPYRACVRPASGKVLIKADYSQIELRLACRIAREHVMLDCYQRGEDLHVKTAQLLLGKTNVTDDDRQIAKSANFGLVYGMGAPGYRAYAKATYGLDLTEEQAQSYRDRFFAAYPELAAWHAKTKRDRVQETRTLTGRRRKLSPDSPDTWRLNTPVQGTGADGLKWALALLWRRRAKCPGAVPILAVHDEIVVECNADQAEHAQRWLIDAMMDGISDLLDPVPCEVDAKATTTWGG